MNNLLILVTNIIFKRKNTEPFMEINWRVWKKWHFEMSFLTKACTNIFDFDFIVFSICFRFVHFSMKMVWRNQKWNWSNRHRCSSFGMCTNLLHNCPFIWCSLKLNHVCYIYIYLWWMNFSEFICYTNTTVRKNIYIEIQRIKFLFLSKNVSNLFALLGLLIEINQFVIIIKWSNIVDKSQTDQIMVRYIC